MDGTCPTRQGRKGAFSRIAGACCALAFGLSAYALPAAAAELDYEPGGPKDFNGVWQVMNTAHYDLEAHHARHAMQLRKGPWGPVPDKRVVALGAVGAVPAGKSHVQGGTIPYKPEALAKRDENRANWIDRDPEVKCYLPGVPRATYMPHPFRIMHNEDALLFVYEYAGAVRNVALEDPGEPVVESWMGQSYGRFEGDTLIIEVTGQNDRTWLDRAGNHHSANLKVTERYTKMGPDHIRYEATLEDPETYTKPWTVSMILYRKIGEDAELMEFNCVEFVEELLYGHLRKEPLE